jgi:hypothetical protein
VLPEGGYQFRRDASLQVTRYEASAAFSIPSGAGGLSISLRAPKSNSLADAFTLNNQTPIARDREAGFFCSQHRRDLDASALHDTIAKCVWVTP